MTSKQLNANRRAMQREAELDDAYDFLVNGEADHSARCIHNPEPCSRTYELSGDDIPDQYAERVAWERFKKDHARSGIGALYGLNARPELLADLAGWNVVPLIEFDPVPLD